MDDLARLAVSRLLERKQILVTAESCTGGLLAAVITSVPGSSGAFDRGFVTYSNRAKIDDLGVDPAIIDRCGAVSAECARAMAVGALRRAPLAHLAVAITGIAGPDGGTTDKPVGTVWIALVTRNGFHKIALMPAPPVLSRDAIRIKAVTTALEWVQICE